ncbi:unnamed protein product [Closterium sp. NIES-65]|nr:unnamed protein product [Closterium sp. NIES-65]
MNVARRSMMHAAAPHFLWPFAVSPAVGDASALRVWGSRAFVRDLSADKLSPCAAPCVFLGSPPDAPWWQFYHPTSRRVLSSQDVTFDESVPYYRLFPYRTPSLPPPPLFLVPVEPDEVTGDFVAAGGAEPGGGGRGGAESGGAEPRGAASGGAGPGGAGPGGAEPGGAAPRGAAFGGAEPGGAEPGGAAPGGAEPGGAASGGAEPRGAMPGGAEPGGATPGGAERGGAPPGGSPDASSRWEPLSPLELREWFARRWRRTAGAGGSSAAEGAAGPAGSTGAGAPKGVGTETTAGGPAGGAPSGAGGSGASGGATGAGAPAEGTGEVPAASGVAARPRPYFLPLPQQVLGLPPSTGPPPPLECPQPPASRPASPVRAARTSGRGSRQRPPLVPGMHRISLRPLSAPLRAPLPSPPKSSLPALADPESDSLSAASPTVTRLLASVVTDPSLSLLLRLL